MRLFASMVPIKFQFPSVTSQTGEILRCTVHQLSPEAQFFEYQQSCLKILGPELQHLENLYKHNPPFLSYHFFDNTFAMSVDRRLL